MPALPLFFYGTLIDADVLAAVIGRRVAAGQTPAARLDGFVRRYRAGASYPILVAEPAGAVDGVLVAGLSAAEVGRLIAFEGNDYDLVEAPVTLKGGRRVPARLFRPAPSVPATGLPWDYPAWRRRHKRRFLASIAAGPR